MFGIGWQELLIIAVIALIIFGRRLPEVGRSLGKGIVEFKKGLQGLEDEVENAGKQDTQPPRIESQDQPTAASDNQAEPQTQRQTATGQQGT
jgi:sec-independent protein translocase protein TatA